MGAARGAASLLGAPAARVRGWPKLKLELYGVLRRAHAGRQSNRRREAVAADRGGCHPGAAFHAVVASVQCSTDCSVWRVPRLPAPQLNDALLQELVLLRAQARTKEGDARKAEIKRALR